VSAFTGGRSMTTSAMPLSMFVDKVMIVGTFLTTK
jgi:hypothetical protein